MLKLTGRFADGWTPSSTSMLRRKKFPEMQKIIDGNAVASRRRPNNIRRNYNLPGRIVLDEEIQGQSQTGVDAEQEGLLIGSSDFWVNTIVKFYNELRMYTFTFWPIDSEIEQIELFAKEVMPGVKEKVAKS